MKKFITTLTLAISFLLATAQSPANFWSDLQELPSGKQRTDNLPSKSRTLSLDLASLVSYLRTAPNEFDPAGSPLQLQMPLPDGSNQWFAVSESPVMEPALAAIFPQIKTYVGRSLQDPSVSMRFGYNPEGFNAIIGAAAGTVLITPAIEGETGYYASYYVRDVEPNLENGPQYACGVHSADWDGMGLDFDPAMMDQPLDTQHRGVNGQPLNLHTYRLAVATTAEYSFGNGNNVNAVLNAVTTVINNVNFVFEREFATRVELIANTTQIFHFGNINTDPYTNGNTQAMLGENPPVLNAAFGADGYDIGHVFGTNAGGLASVGSVCGGPLTKGRGVSCTFGAYGGALFYIIVAHEMGHQFSALHTFNLCENENESEDTAYEPGSGSTIMCYAGASNCGVNYVQDVNDPYFHTNSIERMFAFSRDANSGASCANVVTVGNNPPTVSIPIPDGFSIPISTPFELTATASDPDNDALAYCWEQYDKGPKSTLGMPEGLAPLFRSFIPVSSPVRVFPRIETIVSNTNDITEVLPTGTRPLTFRCTVRDNKAPAGGTGVAEIKFNATAAAGPFLVMLPNASGLSWEVGKYVEVKWDVANTDKVPVNCKNVNIRLSKDGGLTYPVTLLANTPNDGSAFVVVPDEVTSNARVRVEAADNIFFDISNNDFSIVPPSAPGFTLVSSPELGQVCVPDPFSVNIQTASLLGFSDPISFEAINLPAGVMASFTPNPANPGDNVALNLDFTNCTFDGLATIDIQASAAGQPQSTRTVTLNVVYNDFSALQPVQPADGASGQNTLPNFTWTALPNALTYDIQIATDPGFANIVSAGTGLTAASYIPSVTLQENTDYYWRVRGSNECTTSPYMDPASFHTVSQTCESQQSTNQPISISSSGLPLITVPISIAQSGVISDINVTKAKGNHSALRHVEFRLKGPDGTAVKLLSAPSCNGANFELGFDDQSPLTLTACPQTNFTYRSLEPLSAFNGKDVKGDWVFELEVINAEGNGGSFQFWALEYCAALQSANPFLVKNDLLLVPPSGSRLIYQDRLVVDDTDTQPKDLKFTIVKNTQHGYVSVNGTQLGVGSTFTMYDVYASSVQYTNTNPSAPDDYFTFTVSDGQGGFFGTPRFNIKIDPNAPPSSVIDENPSLGVVLYPNPAEAQVTAGFAQPVQGSVFVSILNLQGQQLRTFVFDDANGNLTFDTSNLPAGLYVVQFKTEKGLFANKLTVK